MMRFRMGISSNLLYSLSAICMASGAIGASMLAPFYMDAKGFPLAVVGMPLLVNGVGALCSDVVSGTLASYFRSSFLLLASVVIAVVTALLGYAFEDSLTVFLVAFTILGLTEAMFSLAIRRIVFVQSSPEEQGKAQGQVAAALGLGFALGPTMGGFVGEWWGLDKLFLLVAIPQGIGLVFILLARGHRTEKPVERSPLPLWRVGTGLMSHPGFLGAWLAIFQSFFCLIGVTRIAFPFLAVRRGLTLDIIGTMVSISRLTDTAGRLSGGWLCDRIGTRRVILLGVFVTVPAFVLQIFGHGYITLLLPLCLMTAGFGLSNVGSTTLALQVADDSSKGVALGLIRGGSSTGRMFGPLLAGILVADLGFHWGFVSLGVLSFVIGGGVAGLFRRQRTAA